MLPKRREAMTRRRKEEIQRGREKKRMKQQKVPAVASQKPEG